MSSPAKEEEEEGNSRRTQSYWCGNCDVSIRLLITTTSAAASIPACPHCHGQPLHLMDDDASHSSSSDAIANNFFLLDSPSFRRFLVHHHCSNFNCDDDDSDDQQQQRHYLELLASLEHPSSSPRSSSMDVMIPSAEIEHSLLEIDPTMECAVCKEQFMAGEEAKQLPCSHFFHSHCIIPWLSLHNNNNSSTCPLCRFQLLLPLQNFCSTTVEEVP